ncbi:MAG: DUF2971 domain-containing protein [Gammaproteobacteria bacterium]|nr:DUF2971 domain-containing protein [Gammaproteobacteria bacterium]
MPAENSLEDFRKNHPHPDQLGINTLFKFYAGTQFIETLFISKELYHSLPEKFNDPFECKPNFSWPKQPAKIKKIREHLIKVIRESGITKRQSEKIVSNAMIGSPHEMIAGAAIETFKKIRICCFTSDNKNLLFWAHYANSHKGFCIEFDCTKLPISNSFKVNYQNEYPEVTYPPQNDERAFETVLMKSKHWQYENEFRSVFIPINIVQQSILQSMISDNLESLKLKGDEIINIYLGARIEEHTEKTIINLINKSSFNPKIWKSKLSDSSFELKFEEYIPK